MGFVDHHEVVVLPHDLVEIVTVGFPLLPGEIRVIEDVVTETVLHQRIVAVLVAVDVPVLGELLRTQDEDGLVPAFVVLDHRQSRERLTETDAVRQDAPAVGLQFIDDGQCGIFLEWVEHIPDLRFPETHTLPRKVILRDILQEFVEDVVQGHEVDVLRRVLHICGGDAVQHLVCHILQLLRIVPYHVEQLKELSALRIIGFDHDVADAVPPFESEVHGSEPVQRGVRYSAVTIRDADEGVHCGGSGVGTEPRLLPDPIRTFLGYRLLTELVSETDLELGTVDAALAGHLGDEELPPLLRSLLLDECGGGEDEVELLDGVQLLLQFLIGIDGENRGCDGHLASLDDGLLQVLSDGVVHII